MTDTEKRKKTRRGTKRKSKTTPVEESAPQIQESVEVVQKPYYLVDRRVPDELKSYFKSIESMLNHEFLAEKSEEERQVFIQNVYREVDGREFLLSLDFDGSRILEKLLHVSTDFHRRVLMDRFRGQFYELFTHRYASHVLQTLLCLSVRSMLEDSTGQGEDKVESDACGTLLPMKDLFLDLIKELNEAWITIISDPYGSHLLRLILIILTGTSIHAEDNNGHDLTEFIRSRGSKKYHDHNKIQSVYEWMKEKRPVPLEFQETLLQLMKTFLSQLTELDIRSLATHAVASPVLQMLLLLHQNHETVHTEWIDKILMGIQSQRCLDESSARRRKAYLVEIVLDPVGSVLMEKILSIATDDMFALIFDNLFRDEFVHFAKHPIANHVLQKTFTNVRNENQFSAMVNAFMPHLAHLLMNGRPGVVLSAVVASVKWPSRQKELIKAICGVLEINGQNEESRKAALQCLLRLQPFSDYERQPRQRPFQPMGVRLAQAIFDLPEQNNLFLVYSLCAQSIDQLMDWFTHSLVSRCMEHMFCSHQVGYKVKRKLMYTVSGQLKDLATNKYGSHVLEKAWTVMDLKQKTAVAEELCLHQSELVGNNYGRLVHRNLRLDQFKRRPNDWKEREDGLAKKRKLFADFLDGSVLKQPRQKSLKMDAVGQ